MKNDNISLKEEIKKILEEHSWELLYNECGNFIQKSEYEINEYEIDNVAELILKLIEKWNQ